MKKPVRWPKHEGMQLPISQEILSLFKKRGGIYRIAKKNNLEAPNLYERIYRCDNAFMRIKKLLQLVGHDLKYEIIDLKEAKNRK